MSINITMPDDMLTFKRYDYKEVRETLTIKSAGVYFLYGDDDSLLYVGKTNNFRSRLLSHFRGRDTSAQFYRLIDYVTVYFVDNDFERELYETYAINTFKPLYNAAKVYYDDGSDEAYEINERIRDLEEEARDIMENMYTDGLIDEEYEDDIHLFTGIYLHNQERLKEIKREIKRLNKSKNIPFK